MGTTKNKNSVKIRNIDFFLFYNSIQPLFVLGNLKFLKSTSSTHHKVIRRNIQEQSSSSASEDDNIL